MSREWLVWTRQEGWLTRKTLLQVMHFSTWWISKVYLHKEMNFRLSRVSWKKCDHDLVRVQKHVCNARKHDKEPPKVFHRTAWIIPAIFACTKCEMDMYLRHQRALNSLLAARVVCFHAHVKFLLPTKAKLMHNIWTIGIRAMPAAAISWRTRPSSSWHAIFGFLAPRRILRRWSTRRITPYRLKAPKKSASDATRGATQKWKNRAGPNWHRIGTARTTHARECNYSLCHNERIAIRNSLNMMAK
jgi:hypothetical protein